jgi:hypothetical protein
MNILESPIFEQVVREPLNKSPLARRRLRGMGCAARSSISAVVASPTLPDPCSAGPLGRRSGALPFARSLTRQTACKAPSHPGCGKIGAHGVALLGIVVPATTSVVRLMIIPILTERAQRGFVQWFLRGRSVCSQFEGYYTGNSVFARFTSSCTKLIT